MSATILFQGREYQPEAFGRLDLNQQEFPGLQAGQQFINSWLDNKQIFDQKTSGSTGLPTNHKIPRERFEASAKRTMQALQLQQGSRALVCINMEYIGGKMMLVRGLLGDWALELMSPNAELAKAASGKSYDFAAMVPLQVQKLLNTAAGTEILNNIRCLIIGGAAVSEYLIEQLQVLKCAVYATYGMTETISHIALQKLNGLDRRQHFTVLPGVDYQTDERDCLMLRADVTGHEWIKTNDIVSLNDAGGFAVLGRIDNVINTGGVKVPMELLEKQIAQTGLLGQVSFAIGTIPDVRLGQKIILVVEGDIREVDELLTELKDQLPVYHSPKMILPIEQLPKTASDKLNRMKLQAWLLENA